MLGLVMVAVGWWLCGLLWVVGVLVRSGLVSVAVLRWRMYCRMLVVGLRRRVGCGDGAGEQLGDGADVGVEGGGLAVAGCMAGRCRAV